MPFEQDKKRAASERKTSVEGLYFVETLMVKTEAGLYLGSLVIRTLRPEIPTPRDRRSYLVNLKETVEGRIDAAS